MDGSLVQQLIKTFLKFFFLLFCWSLEDSFLDEQKAVEDIITDFRCNRFYKISNKLIITEDWNVI